MLADADTTAEIEERLLWLAWQTETLLRARADTHHAFAHQARWGQPGKLPPVTVHTALVLAGTATSPEAAETARDLHALGLDISILGADLAAPDPGLPAIAHHAPWFASVEEVLQRLSGRFDAVALCDADVAVRYTPLLRHHQPQALLILLQPEPEAAVPDQPDLIIQAAQAMARDLRAISDADVTVTGTAVTAWQRLLPKSRFAPTLEASITPARSDSG
jgi:hypothetical protein